MTDTLIAGGRPGWMVVDLGEVRAALPIESVGEVLPMPALSPVPMAPAWVAGIVSVRAAVVPVVDLRMRLHGQTVGADARMVMATPEGATEAVGLLVDGIAGLIERTGAQQSEGDASDTDVPARFVARRVTSGSAERVPVLDIAALLDPDLPSGA